MGRDVVKPELPSNNWLELKRGWVRSITLHSSHSAMALPRLPASRRMMRVLAVLASLPNAYAYAVSPAAVSLTRFAPHRCASSTSMAEKPQSLSQVRVNHLPRPVPG